MPRKCTICTHPRREEIDRGLVEGESFRSIAERFGVSLGALHRHREHVQDDVQQAIEAKAVRSGRSVLDRIRELNREARSLLEEARSKGRYAAAVQAIGAATRLLELEAKLLGELDERPSVNVQMGMAVMVPKGVLEAIYRAVLDAPEEVRERVALALAEVPHEG